MRLFYDEYSSARRGDILLLFSDCLAILAAVLFATGAPFHAHESLWDVVLLGTWALIPRNIAKFLEWLGRPHDFLLAFSLSLGFVVFVTLLLVAGWEILDLTMANDQPMRAGTAALILVLWGSGYLLCHARSYRLHDFLLAAVLLLGLLQRMPLPYLWLPLCFVGISLSAACRHLLHDVFAGIREIPLNLQNVRSLALVSTLIAVGLFAAVHQGLYPLLDAGAQERAIRTGEGAEWFSWGRGADGGNPSGWGALMGTGDSRRIDGPRRTADGRTPDDGIPPGSSEDVSRRRIGFTHRIKLQDLATPRFDRRKVIVVREESPGDEPPARGRWRPNSYTLWKVMAFSSFDATTSMWIEDTEYVRDEWDEHGRHVVPRENTGLWTASVAPVWLRIEVIVPVFRNLVTPYAPMELGPVQTPGGASKELFLRNSFGDIVPHPALGARSRYYAKVRPAPGGLLLPPQGDSRPHPDQRYLELPRAEWTQVDLKALASTIFRDAVSVRDKVRALTTYYGKRFQRSNVTTWHGNHDHLRKFLLDERVGDCTYFSTASALLLRAAGVSTRLAVGFVGGEAEPDGAFCVRNSSAHGWLEVYTASHGWFPLDPTAWAPPAPIDPANAESPGRRDASFQIGDGPDARELTTGRRPRDPFAPDGESPREPGADDRDRPGDPFAAGRSARNPDDPASGWRGPPGRPRGDHGPFGGIFGGSFFDDQLPGEGRAGDPTGFDIDRRDTAGQGEDSRTTLSGTGDSGKTSRLMQSALVRSLLVLLGSGAVLLAVVAYLRPRRREEKDNDEDEVAESVEPLGLTDDDPLSGWRPANDGEAVLCEYHRMQVDLSRTRSHRRPHQTPIEHGGRFRGRDEKLDGAFARLHRILYATLYGRRRASSDDARNTRRECRTIRRHLT